MITHYHAETKLIIMNQHDDAAVQQFGIRKLLETRSPAKRSDRGGLPIADGARAGVKPMLAARTEQPRPEAADNPGQAAPRKA